MIEKAVKMEMVTVEVMESLVRGRGKDRTLVSWECCTVMM